MSRREAGSPGCPIDAAPRTVKPGKRHGCDAASSVGARVSSSSVSPEGSLKGSASDESAERDYVQAVLDCYLCLPGTASITSRHDRRCARALFRRGVPLDLAKAAMVVAVARRTFRTGDPLLAFWIRTVSRGAFTRCFRIHRESRPRPPFEGMSCRPRIQPGRTRSPASGSPWFASPASAWPSARSSDRRRRPRRCSRSTSATPTARCPSSQC